MRRQCSFASMRKRKCSPAGTQQTALAAQLLWHVGCPTCNGWIGMLLAIMQAHPYESMASMMRDQSPSSMAGCGGLGTHSCHATKHNTTPVLSHRGHIQVGLNGLWKQPEWAGNPYQ